MTMMKRSYNSDGNDGRKQGRKDWGRAGRTGGRGQHGGICPALFGLNIHKMPASLVSSVGSMVSLLTRWYWVQIPVGLALHLISPHPRVCK